MGSGESNGRNPPGRIDDHSYFDEDGVLNICIGAPCKFDPPGVPTGTDPYATASQLGGAALEVGASMIPGVGEAMDVYTLLAPDSTLLDRGLSVVSLGANVLTAGLLPNFGGWLKAGRKAAGAIETAGDIAKTADKGKDIGKGVGKVADGAAEGAAKNGSTFTKSPKGPGAKKPRQPRKYKKKVVNEDGSVTYTFEKKTGELVDITYRDGYPDFSQELYKGPAGKSEVQIEMTGNNNTDFKAANQAAGFGNSATSHPDGYTWHHNQDGKTMQLVETGAHAAAPHTGGASAARAK